jgi:hypothetical protein
MELILIIQQKDSQQNIFNNKKINKKPCKIFSKKRKNITTKHKEIIHRN